MKNQSLNRATSKPALKTLIIKTDEDRSIPVTREEYPKLIEAFETWLAIGERSEAERHAWDKVIGAGEEYLTQIEDDGDDNISDVFADAGGADYHLPADPENLNDKRAEWAHRAILAFEDATGVDREDALCDLLADLMHWGDRNGQDFESQLDRARFHYAEETSASV